MDYSKLGLKVGLEIHQQLNSGSKLFCRCPLVKAEDFPLEIRRKMNPVQSELGEDDPAALFEYLRNRTFIYKANTNSSCLIEMDESPPLPVNENALKMVVQLSKLMNCKLVDEIYFMRKTVIDGSAVSGFQRTGLIATDGFIETSFGRLGVQTISLEEDSAPALSKGESIEYRLDRLGTPLIEIATDPDIHTPGQAKEAATIIGTLLRSVYVVRGIGSIRQDVNISITGGSRVEIKGFQELDKIPELVENEVKRQSFLVEVKNELKKR
jgi:glutamyl-tRNA(Gln) amidotransferase subunit E